MKALKIKKGPILLPLLLLAAALGAYTLLNYQGVTAADSLSLGEQQLNNLDYSGAVASFTQAISLDPSSRDARIGLAKAYAGAEEYDFAQQVLDDLVGAERPDEDAALVMVDILRKNGRLSQAARMAQFLVDATDGDEYYALRDELLSGVYDVPCHGAAGNGYSLLLRNGQVLGRGSNDMGQLGLDPAATAFSDSYSSCGFNGTAVKVACAGRTSLVVDQSGGLWAAGEDRWGQMGEGYGLTSSRSGWRQLACPGPVADVAGTTGRLLVLLRDGSLWTAGAGGDQTFRRLSFPVVSAIAASQDRAAVLTVGGQLHVSRADAPEQWTLAASNVVSFTLSGSGLCWVTGENGLCLEQGQLNVPASWYNGDIYPDFTLEQAAVLENGSALLLGTGDRLYRLPGDGTVQELQTDSPVRTLRPMGGLLLLEHADGSASWWNPASASLEPTDTL